ncbi:hypothetical protein F-VV10_0231 [Faustovirus]|nr:hypothetical protein F-VV10_0231 [Faustovirus]
MPQGDKSALCKFYVVPTGGAFSTWKQFKKACMRRIEVVELG